MSGRAAKRSFSLALATVLVLGLLPVSAHAAAHFDDVPAGSAFAENVETAGALGLMIGQTATHFGVKSELSRLAALILACRVNSLYEYGENRVDADEAVELAGYLAYAEAHGLWTELPVWHGAVTRAELAMLLGSALPDEALPALNEVADDTLPDVELSDACGPAVYRLYRAGVLTGGDAGGTFRPDQPITRGAASAIATRLADASLRKTFTLYRSDKTEITLAGGTLTRRTAVLGNGDRVVFGSLTGAPSAGTVVAEAHVPGGTLHLFSDGWSEQTIAPGDYEGSLWVADSTDGRSYMAYAPQSWEKLTNGSRRYRPGDDGTLRITAEEDGFCLEVLSGAAPAGTCADFTFVSADGRLLDWNRRGCASLWSGYGNHNSGRWCFDGYYWPSPDTYVPSGEDVYYQMTDAYLCRSFLALTDYDRLAYDLAVSMMDVMADRQNEEGFFPTHSGSTWLSGDYGIGPGFYDTRFNTDLMEMFLDAEERYGLPRFSQVIERYAAFYTAYAAGHHTETGSGGWLVWDYFNPAGGRQTHTSLNHQLAEMLLLYHLSDRQGDAKLGELADTMRLAVRDTQTDWIRADSNLHYAVYPDGSFGGTDYPYLTYNDLYAVQRYLEQVRGVRDPSLDRLMAAKKIWMDANGVTEYKQ